MSAYRVGLPQRPDRIAMLPLNEKGYPIPWFVGLHNGVLDFRFMDGEKWRRAVQGKLCFLCGCRLGRYMTFVAGPMCGINRTSAEPPNHIDCAEYAVKACPFLTLPKAKRREAGMPEDRNVAGKMIERNPGVTMLYTTKSYKVYNVENGALIEMGEPYRVDWYSEGREATRAEVDESIRTGLPALQEMAAKQRGATEELQHYIDSFQTYLPVAI
jgi:hypothetical protein